MTSTLNVLVCAAVATMLWTGIGASIARRIAPPLLAWPIAPALGWAVHSAAMLAILRVAGFSRITVGVGFAVPLLASIAALARRKPGEQAEKAPFPLWPFAGAALVALIPAIAILPKRVADGVALAGPIFDHSKIAIVDEIARLGLPPGNPFFGGEAAAIGLSYYYLWHFSAAELSRLLGISGWEADAALTWFTTFSSLSLMIGLAIWLSGRTSAAAWVLFFTLAGSLQPVMSMLVGLETMNRVLGFSGLSVLLFQASWAPQHVASAACVVLAIMLMSRLTRGSGTLAVMTFALVVAAGFGSSTWVGGVLFAFAAPVSGLVLFANLVPAERPAFALKCALTALVAVGLAFPLLHEQYVATAMRAGGLPIVVHPYDVWGPVVPESVRRLLDLPGYWLVLLVIEFPAFYLTGVFALAGLLVAKDVRSEDRRVLMLLAALTVTSLVAAWLLVSTVGYNNDFGWRAVLPGIMVLTGLAAAGVSRWIAAPGRKLAVAAAFGLAALGMPGGLQLIRSNVVDPTGGRPALFALAPSMWAAVRKHATPDERVGNNPLFLQDVTPWPVNISWALMANRRSCYAGWELALAFVPLPEARRKEIDAQFIRVFAGDGTPDDVGDLATLYGCRVVVVSAEDGAWRRDPFAVSAHYRLAETEAGKWRIYVTANAVGNIPDAAK